MGTSVSLRQPAKCWDNQEWTDVTVRRIVSNTRGGTL